MCKIDNYDFSGKRVKYLGKSMSKFDLSFHISHLCPYSCYGIYPDAYDYSDYVAELKSCLHYVD